MRVPKRAPGCGTSGPAHQLYREIPDQAREEFSQGLLDQ